MHEEANRRRHNYPPQQVCNKTRCKKSATKTRKNKGKPKLMWKKPLYWKRKPESKEETMEGYEKENKEAKVRLLGSRGQVVKVYLLLNRSYFHNIMLFPIRQQSLFLHLILLVQNIPSLVCFLFFSKINFPPK